MKNRNWTKYLFEFISIFIAVVSAFALNNWNENRRDSEAETKILVEMSSGLSKDILDIENNIGGHELGLDACKYFRRVINNTENNVDTLSKYYYCLMRGFFPVQNKSGYETLKSKGLELIKNDSLRFHILSLYDFDYYAIKRLEENSYEMQFDEHYSTEINQILSKNFQFDAAGSITGLNIPLEYSDKEEQLFLTYLWQIEINRKFMIGYYSAIKDKIQVLKGEIEAELKR